MNLAPIVFFACNRLWHTQQTAKKGSWGTLRASWVPHDIRDTVVDFVKHWSQRTGLAVTHLLGWLGLATSKYYNWQQLYGKVNEHNALISVISGWRIGTTSQLFIAEIGTNHFYDFFNLSFGAMRC